MSNRIEVLRELGCDVDGALDRCLMDEDFYLSLLEQAIADEAFEKLGKSLDENDIETAFDYAHTLKGILANMGLTPLYDVIVIIVETLRKGESQGLDKMYQELLAKRDKMIKDIGM